MSNPVHVTTVFYGEDEPRLKDELARLLADLSSDSTTADLNLSRLDGKSVQLGAIESAAGTLPFMADQRVVLVENLTENSGARDMIEVLPRVLEALPDWARLVFVETGLQNSSDSTSAAKRLRTRKGALKKLINVVEADRRGRVLSFGMPKKPAAWISERAAHYGTDIEAAAARELAQRINENLVLADTELIKLATYVNDERPIRREDVEKLTPYTAEANIFHMVDALGQRQGDTALRLLQNLIEDGEEPLRVFGMIVRQYRLLLQAKALLDRGQTANTIAKVLSVPGFVANKLAAQSRYYSLDVLERIYRHLLQVDVSMKGQSLAIEGMNQVERMEPQLALEVLTTRLAGRG